MAQENEQAIRVDARELYRVRMPILLETGPQTGVYRQVLLQKEDYESIARFILTRVKGTAAGTHFIVDTSWDIELPENIKDYM